MVISMRLGSGRDQASGWGRETCPITTMVSFAMVMEDDGGLLLDTVRFRSLFEMKREDAPSSHSQCGESCHR